MSVIPSTEQSLTLADFPNRQEFYRYLYRHLKPGWEDSLAIYIRSISQHVHTDTHVLDIGCGHGDFLRDVYARTPHTYGIDPDAEALASNSIIQHTTVGSTDQLLFEDQFFDLVVSAWVLEHLEQPEQAFQEVYRVLKPGGRVIFLTPNAWNYNVWLIRMFPNRLHSFFVRWLYKRQECDTYPVRYAINSPLRIQRILGSIGFRKVHMILNGDPTYISFNKLLFFLACRLEAILDLKCFRCARVHIISIYEKP